MAFSNRSIFIHLLLLAITAFAKDFQSHGHAKDRPTHAARDENFTSTPGSPQNLCEESAFEFSSDTSGPRRDDCALLHKTIQRNPHGFWTVSRMGSDGMSWVEMTRVRSCGVKVRRTDGQSGTVPIGDSDVVDLVNDVLGGVSVSEKMPKTRGNMTCSKGGSSAAVEWVLLAV